MAIPVVHHADYITPPNPATRYRWSKNQMVRDLLRGEGMRIEWIEPPAMPLHWIAAVHDPAYVAEVVGASVPKEKERRIGFAVNEPVARRAVRVPGGTWTAALTALTRGYAVNIAGGSHHALHDTGAGYCVFNDLAIAAHRLVTEGAVARVLVVDCDVHQGDGTARLTADMAGIATYSIHAASNFPARKATSTLDVPLPDRTSDTAYLAALEATLVPLLDSFRPDLILYQGGVDPYEGDRLGRLALTERGLDARDRFVARAARSRGVPVAGTLGGGYGTDIAEVAARHVRSILTFAGAYADA
ncbi:histone deacetylase [Sphingomonas solaris]|uniref:Histone deacetylase n=1 Tax=Alterirhizorhabdus solaris TaxID=2529389 RepID=A0A558RBU7_9SPHN|nr:histone deacetylase [Sphingomonas solaris]TVV76856.1 histone deacetylase [Sphingomonas solaris]